MGSKAKTYTIQILKGQEDAFGFTIGGGRGNPAIPGNNGIVVTAISKYGAAAKDGRLRVGDQILEVNSVKLTDVRHADAAKIFAEAGEVIKLTVLSKPENLARLTEMEGGKGKKSGSRAKRLFKTLVFLAIIGAGIAVTYKRIKK